MQSRIPFYMARENDDFWDVDKRMDRLGAILSSFKEKDDIYIVFICNGNICRSPYAEIMLEKRINEELSCGGKIHVTSGGSIKNTTMHPFTRRGLQEKGVDDERIDQFHPKWLKKENKVYLQDADLIIAPEKMIIDVLLPRRYHQKAFLMSEFTGSGFVDIEDPALIKDFDAYKVILNQIDPTVEALIDAFKKEGVCNGSKNP
ncbi:MAG: arsenate-mycothiol transferase ArsC [Promethearchaeota archaeon]